MSIADTLRLFSPELILTLFGLIVLSYDMLVRRQERGQATLTLVGLGLSLIAAVWVRGESAVLFSGMFVVDPFTTFFRIVSIITGGLILMGSVDYLRQRSSYRGEFYSLLLFTILSMTLMAGSSDLIMVILSIEFLSITSYILTGWLRGDIRSSEASVKYFLYGSITTAAMVYGASLLYGLSGHTNLAAISQVLQSPDAAFGSNLRAFSLPAAMLLLTGFSFKIALVPFHQWSPDAYEGAPTPVTAFLSIGPKAVGFAMLVRVFLTALPYADVEWTGVLIGIAIITMTLGNMVAIVQKDIKRLLAYSSIAQAGYMLIGIASLSAAGETGIDAVASTLLYVFAYVFTNMGAFAIVIAIDNAEGSSAITAYRGLIRRHPLMAVSMFIFFLSLVGIPPTAGFIGKFSVFLSAVDARLYGLAAIGVVNGVISVAYYFGVVKEMFFLGETETEPVQVGTWLQAALVVSLVMTLVIGLYPEPFIELANNAAEGLMGIGQLLALR
ncbi:MAG: NADH-quinone oxidoreductase subunit N [Anaerolineae bacterium]